jgi:hypothetical protein
MKIKNIIRGLIKEAINRSYGSMDDLAKYRDINLDSPSSLSKARSSQGLKVSDVGDLSKNIPFNKKMERLYGMILGYMANKFKLKRNSKDIRERGNQLKEFIKNFLTRDEVESFYYRLNRFNRNAKEFKRICEQFINYMQSGEMSDTDVYDKVDMGDDDNDLAFKPRDYGKYEGEWEKYVKQLEKKIMIGEEILKNISYGLVQPGDINMAVTYGLLNGNEFKSKLNSENLLSRYNTTSSTSGKEWKRISDIFNEMVHDNLTKLNDQLKNIKNRMM